MRTRSKYAKFIRLVISLAHNSGQKKGKVSAAKVHFNLERKDSRIKGKFI